VNAAHRCRLILTALPGLLAAGCVSKVVVPQARPVPDDSLPRLTVRQPVAVVRVSQPDAPNANICGDMGKGLVVVDTFARLDDLTNVAAATLVDLLRRNQAAVADGAPKALEISVTKVNCPWVNPWSVVVRVTVRGESSHEFTGSSIGSGRETWSVDSINAAVVSALKNRTIRAYLED